MSSLADSRSRGIIYDERVEAVVGKAAEPHVDESHSDKIEIRMFSAADTNE